MILRIEVEQDCLVVYVPEEHVEEFCNLLDDHGVFYKDKADEDDPELGYCVIYEVDRDGLDVIKSYGV